VDSLIIISLVELFQRGGCASARERTASDFVGLVLIHRGQPEMGDV